VELSDELTRVAAIALDHAGEAESLAAVIPAEPVTGLRVYLCAFGDEGEDKSWLALDAEGQPIRDRALLRDAVTIAAVCELAEDAAGGGKLEELRTHLVALRVTEQPEGIEEAEEAALALERLVGQTPRLASPARLDEIGDATRRLERALGHEGRSPLTEALGGSAEVADALVRDVESRYRVDLDA
jgi:hypothetical protein